MEKVTFIDITNYIFENKQKYLRLTDKDKYDNFYIINKKFSLSLNNEKNITSKNISDLEIWQKYNNKFIDRTSVIDMWFLKFRKEKRIPYWYWAKSPFKKDAIKNKISNKDRELLIDFLEIDTKTYDFLYKYYIDDLEYELKKLKRFKNT